jgi:hypothetical protein
MTISIRKLAMLFALAAMFGATEANLKAQQDNSREIKPFDLSVHADIASPARESQQSLELSPQPPPSSSLLLQKKDLSGGICPESTSNNNEEKGSTAKDATKSTPNLSQWTVSRESRPSAQKFGQERIEVPPAEDCLQDQKSGKHVDRLARPGASTLPRANHTSPSAWHSRVLTPPAGLESSVDSPLSSLFRDRQLTPSTDFSLTKSKIPKAPSKKEKSVAADSFSEQPQDSFETESSKDMPDNRKD